MFDIGFGELLVCAVVALLVLGPERLPGAVRTVGRWVGRARHTVNNFTDQIDREMRAEELKRRIDEEIRKAGVHEVTQQVNDALHAPLKLPEHLASTTDTPEPATQPEPPAENSIAPPTAPAAEQPAATPTAVTPPNDRVS